MVRYYFFLTTIIIFKFSLLSGQSTKVSGRVYWDKNGNNLFDRGDRLLKNIPLSNGDTIVLSSNKGEFEIEVSVGKSLFPILPSGYDVAQKIKNSAFQYFDKLTENTSFFISFPLIKKEINAKFRIGAVGDVQIDNLQEAFYANKTIMAELLSRNDLDFHIFLGDMVNSDSQMEPIISSMLKQLNTPSWVVYGNHDRNYDAKHQDSIFNSYFGASHYAFNYGEVHFIVLNNVWSDGGRAYKGLFSPEQIRFVANDLALVPENKLVVLCQHIPMAYTRNKEELFSVIGDSRKVLILSGHTHRVERHFYTDNISELGVGASCGGWWTGERYFCGIPHALMQDGSPRNYFIIDFDGSDYSFRFKGVGMDDSKQMNIWVNGQDTIDTYVKILKELDKNSVIVNVYAGSERTKVFMNINNNGWQAMEPIRMIAPEVARIIAMNRSNVFPTKFSRKSALRSSSSPHLWLGYIPDTIEVNTGKIEIKAFDNYGLEVYGSNLFLIK